MMGDSTRVTFRLGGEPRLVAAVYAATRFAASQAGLDSARCEEFARASEEVCRESLLQLTDAAGSLEVVLETFLDRIEICIYHPGQLISAVGLETFVIREPFAGRPGGLSGAELLECVDRILFHTDGGIARTTLVKFLPPKL